MLLVLLQLLLLLLSFSLLLPRCFCCCCCCDPLPASQLWRPPCAVVKNYKQFMRLGCLLYLLQFTPSTSYHPPLPSSCLLISSSSCWQHAAHAKRLCICCQLCVRERGTGQVERRRQLVVVLHYSCLSTCAGWEEG